MTRARGETLVRASPRSPLALVRNAQRHLVAAAHAQRKQHKRDRHQCQQQPLRRIQLPTRWFRLVWCTLVVLRFVLMSFLAFLAGGYWFMTTPVFENPRASYKLPPPRTLLTFSAILGVGAVVYAYQLAHMVYASVTHHRLLFPRRTFAPMLEDVGPRGTNTVNSASNRATSVVPVSAIPMTPQHKATPALRTLWRRARVLYIDVFGPRGPLGIEHPYFFELLLAREVTEIALQGYQTYTSTTLVPRRWISDLATALLVLNCWSTLLVHALVRSDTPQALVTQRALCLAADMALDVGWSIVVPMCIVAPYLVAYDRRRGSFSPDVLADNSFQLSWEMDVRQFCFTSWLDFVSSVFPYVGILTSSRTIAALIDEQRTRVTPAAQPSSEQPQVQLSTLSSTLSTTTLASTQSLAPPDTVETPQPMPPAEPTNTLRTASVAQQQHVLLRYPHEHERQRHRRPSIDAHFVVFFSLGCAILCVHAYAIVAADRLRGIDTSCLVQLRPWFTRDYACAYANINCDTARTQEQALNLRADSTVASAAVTETLSDEAVIATRLARLAPSVLQYLVIAHAPNLTIPSAIRSFANLRMLEIYNASLVAWPRAAALSIATHPNLWKFSLIRTNLSTFPESLTEFDLPLVVVNFVATNLTTLPTTFAQRWRALKYLSIERCALRAVPPAVAAISTLSRLSLCANQLETLTTATGLASAYTILNVAQNPLLGALPIALRDTTSLRELSFEHTHIASVPSWVTAALAAPGSKLHVNGFASPFCDDRNETQHDSESPFGARSAAIRCRAPGLRANCVFPLTLMTRVMDALADTGAVATS